MSVNILNNDKTLTKISSNNNINKHDRGSYIGRRDTLWIGNVSGNIELALTHPITDYDYIDIEFSSSKWFAFHSTRYSKSALDLSNSSNKLRFYINDSDNFSFYRSSDTSLYFAGNKLIIKKILGYKMGITKATITNPSQGDLYTTWQSTNIVGKWIDGKNIYRTMYEYKLTSSTNSNLITIPYSITFKDIVKCNCFVISNGITYRLPYMSSSGNVISLSTITSGNDISFVNKGLTWNRGTIFRIILEYTI